MANTTETATFNVKSNVGEVGKDAASAAGEFRVMGVSLNGVKAGFVSAGKSAKLMFASIRAGIMSTGIGALILAVVALVSHFTNTKRGADKLEKAFAGMGAVVDVLKDRLSKLGEAISFVFSGEWSKAGKAFKGVVSGIADEIEREVAAMTALKQRTHELRDADMAFMVQKAATRQEIEKARLNAEDETKSAEERLAALKKALELEAKTTDQELVLAKERMLIQQEEMKQSENLIEDEQKLAQLKVALIETETASVKMRRRVITEVNALEREIQAANNAAAKERQDAIDAEAAALQKLLDIENTRLEAQLKLASGLLDEYNTKQLSAIEQEKKALQEKYQAVIQGETEGSAMRLQLEENLQSELAAIDTKYTKQKEENAKLQVKFSEMTSEQQLGIASQTAGNLATILGEETEAGRAMAIVQATIDTFASAQASYKALAGIPVVGPALGGIAAAAAVAAGLKNIQAIKSAGAGGAGGGAGGGGNINAGASAQTPAPQMMSGAFDLTGGQAPEAMRAYVVTDEMTNSQNQLANIRRRATI
jgi:hypothetical protein